MLLTLVHPARSRSSMTMPKGRSQMERASLKTLQIARLAAYVSATLFLLPMAWHPLRGSNGHLTLVTDDFYYYALTAARFVDTGRLSFDGITTTNGFHPLHMGILTALTFISNGLTSHFWLLLAVTSVGLVVGTFELLLVLGRRLLPASELVPAVALLVTLEVERMACWGMEVTPALVLILLVCVVACGAELVNFRNGAVLGLLSALMVLARLDTIMLAGLLIAMQLLRCPGWRARIHAVAGLTAGLLPLAAYLVTNVVLFGSPLTVSAQSKQINSSFNVNLEALLEIVAYPSGMLACLVVPVALFWTGSRVWRIRKLDMQSVVVLGGLSFPLLFYATFALRSSWILFQWYFYPLVPATFLGLLVVSEHLAQGPVGRRLLRGPATRLSTAFMGCVVVVVAAGTSWKRTYEWRSDANSIYVHAIELAKFGKEHAGVYAMGDRAGLTAFMLNRPVIQLEGLAADQRMVDNIKAERDLINVLESYAVDYIIVSVPVPLETRDHCWIVTQPHRRQSGEDSKKMSGRFCKPPVFEFTSSRSELSGRVHTYVFQLADRDKSRFGT